MIHRFAKLLGVSVSLSVFGAGCLAPTLTPLCQPRVSSPNKVSTIFRAEDPQTGEPVTDLIERFKKGPKLLDGSVSTGLESMPKALSRPGSIAMRTLLLIDGSGSLADANSQAQIKRAVTAFARQNAIISADGRAIAHTIGVYKFRGESRILPIYPFSVDREKSLSAGVIKLQNPSITPAELERRLADARARDLDAMIQAIEVDKIGLAGTSTNLYDALNDGIATISRASAVQDFEGTQIQTRTLIVFTDGREEASDTTERRSRVLERAATFKRNSDNRIFMVGVRARGVSLDRDFMEAVASSKGFIQRRIDEIGSAFDEFANRSVAQTRKFYQLNFCSNRRGGTRSVGVHFKKFFPPIDWSFSFDYDASRMKDPTESESCDPEAKDFPTCVLTGESELQAGFLDRTKMDMHSLHSCVVTNGEVKCWGTNKQGQAGGSYSDMVIEPARVPGITSASAVGVGTDHTCALIQGSVACWGSNDNGQLGQGPEVRSAASEKPLWVRDPSGSRILTGIRAIGVGNSFTCALAESGSVYCWGLNQFGQLGALNRTAAGVCPISGAKICSTLPVQVQGLTAPVSMLSVNGAEACGLVGDRVFCWGSNGGGGLGNISKDFYWSAPAVPVETAKNVPLTGVRRIVGEWDHHCALAEDRVYCWGANWSGQAGAPETGGPLCYGFRGLEEGQKTECRPVATLVPISFEAPVQDVWTGGAFSCAALLNGKVLCWGSNGNAEFGAGNRTDESTPYSTGAPGLSKLGPYTGVTSSRWATCLRQNWETWCWGGSSEGGELAPILNPGRVSTKPIPFSFYGEF